MSATVAAAQIRPSIATRADPSPAAVRDREGLFAILDDIDRAGWDSQPAEMLLAYVRATVVRPSVAATGLTGPAADQAEATAWEATWEALTLPSLRAARSPWGVLWATARRAALGELVAGVYCTDVWSGWRLARTDSEFGASGERLAVNGDVLRYRPPVSLADLVDHGVELPARPQLAGLAASTLLSSVVRALVDAGWPESQAKLIVDAVSGGADEGSRTASGTRGWRHLARALRMPPWQLRRVTVVMFGAQGWPGLVERLAIDGPEVLTDPGMLAALRSTLVSWSPSPATAARRAERTNAPNGCEAA
jgi:hypothetical protein